MNVKKYKIVFMGTPEVGIPPLQALIDDPQFDVIGVFTNPDRPIGRKQILTSPPIKLLAEKYDIPVFQPEKFGERAEEQLRVLEPDVAVVIAYGKILKQSTLDIPKYGVLNVHYSLLPKYRGAVPVQAAIIADEKITGNTIQKMAAGMDTGDILSQYEAEIEANETSGELLDRLSQDCAGQLIETLRKYLADEITPVPQDELLASYCYQKDIAKENAQIDWEDSATEIHNFVRGLNPWPVAWTTLDDKRVKIYKTLLTDRCKIVPETPGIAIVQDGRLFVVCGHGLLEILEIQVEGRNKVEAKDFIRGYSGIKFD